MLDLQSLAVGYRNTRGTVLSGIDLSAAPGDFICILGRNGSGKSTLMRTIAGLQASLDGTALLDGEDIASMRPATRARRIAVVLTERQFNPGLRVDDVIALARQPFTGWQGGLADDDRTAIADAVEVTGVEPFLRRQDVRVRVAAVPLPNGCTSRTPASRCWLPSILPRPARPPNS